MKKRELYYSGMPTQQDPGQPLPGELPPGTRARFYKVARIIGLIGLGALLGVMVSPESPRQAKNRIAELEAQLTERNAQVAELDRTLKYGGISNTVTEGKLRPIDRLRHESIGKRYAGQMRASGAQPAAELMEWFVERWNQLLDVPEPGDRRSRRAKTLSLLVGGMARNLDPDDYVQWQAEFFNAKSHWLGELHFDIDGDGLPGKRSSKNELDSFADVSVCHIAMALNQAVTDAQVLVMPQMRCDSPKARMSVFLQGRTWNDALDELVRALRAHGFLIVEKRPKKVRLILIGPGTRRGP